MARRTFDYYRRREAPSLRFTAERGSELARLRNEAHHAFDVHWEFYDTFRERHAARNQAYSWLARKLGISEDACHFGMFDEEMCRRALRVCRSSRPGQ